MMLLEELTSEILNMPGKSDADTSILEVRLKFKSVHFILGLESSEQIRHRILPFPVRVDPDKGLLLFEHFVDFMTIIVRNVVIIVFGVSCFIIIIIIHS